MVAIVTGSTGQDGSYIIDLLKEKGYEVIALTRETICSFPLLLTEKKIDEFYNFAGISNVLRPYENVSGLFRTNTGLVGWMLEEIARLSPKTKFFQASSCLSLHPYYPYGVSKRAADELIKQYRNHFGIYACSGIFWPHESPRRKDHFFTKKVVNAAKKGEQITVGDLDVMREFGYAPDYMETAWLMLQQDKPKDYHIGTGLQYSLRDFAEAAFELCGLNYKAYVTEDKKQSRVIPEIICDPTMIFNELGWKAKHNVGELLMKMINE